MSLVFCCGAECSLVGPGAGSVGTRHISSVTGTPTISTTTLRGPHSARSFRCNATAGEEHSLRHDITGVAQAVFRGYFRYNTALPTALSALLDSEYSGGSSCCTLEFRQTDSKLILTTTNGGGVTVVGPLIAITEWYRIDMHVDAAGTGGNTTVHWSVNGVPQADLVFAHGADTIISWLWGCNMASTTATTVDVFWDDLALANSATDYPLGHGKVIIYLAASDGTHNFNATGDFQGGTIGSLANLATGVTTAFQSVDNLPSTNTTALAAAAAAAGEYLALKYAPTLETIAPRGVELLMSVRNASTNTANKASFRIFDGTTESVVVADYSHGAGTTVANLGYHFGAPMSGGTWTVALQNALQLRFGSSWTVVDEAPVPYVTAVAIEVEYPQRSLFPVALLARPFFITRRRRA